MDRIKINWPLTPPKNDTAAEKEKEKKRKKVLVSFGFGVRKSGCVLKREMGVTVNKSKRESVCVLSLEKETVTDKMCGYGRYKEKVTTQETDIDTERIYKVER